MQELPQERNQWWLSSVYAMSSGWFDFTCNGNANKDKYHFLIIFFLLFYFCFKPMNPMTNGGMREGRGGIDSKFPLRGDLEE